MRSDISGTVSAIAHLLGLQAKMIFYKQYHIFYEKSNLTQKAARKAAF
jgi:hypothetical protein